MNITALLGTNVTASTGGGTSSSQAAAVAATAVPQVLAKADQRIKADVASTTAQLSSYGLLKSAVSDSQVAAKALTNLTTTSSETEVTKATANLFNAFNATVVAAKATSTVSSSTPASQSAARISRDLKWAMSSGAATGDAMKMLGLKIQSDGTLVQDAKNFAASLKSDPVGVRAALATIGKQVDAVATKELESSGAVGSALASLNLHSTALATQQKALLKLEQAMATGQGSSIAGATTTSTANAGYTGLGLSAYLSNTI